jgi:hypothetical protein
MRTSKLKQLHFSCIWAKKWPLGARGQQLGEVIAEAGHIEIRFPPDGLKQVIAPSYKMIIKEADLRKSSLDIHRKSQCKRMITKMNIDVKKNHRRPQVGSCEILSRKMG